MNFISRALKNSTRRLSKSILLLITFFVIGNFVIIGLGVSDASENAKILARQSMRAVVNYEFDFQALYEAAEEIEDEEERMEFIKENQGSFTLSNASAMLSDPRVKAANALDTRWMYSMNFKSVPIGNERENEQSGSMRTTVNADGEVLEMEYVEPNVMVYANALPNMIEFADGMYILTDGRMYTQEEIDDLANVALITNTLAEQNGLSIGDIITFSMNSPSDFEYEQQWLKGITLEMTTFELEIIGIFDNIEEIDPNAENFEWMSTAESPENIVLMPKSTHVEKNYEMQLIRFEQLALEMPEDEYYGNPDNIPTMEQMNSIYNVIMLLNDPLEVDAFVEEYELANAVPFTEFDANNDDFNKLSKPLDTMSMFSNLIVWLVVINAIIIITLVTALTLKTREYEIGVLLSMGVSKFKVVAQFFLELSIVAILGFTLAVLSGSMIAKEVGNGILEYQVSISDVEEEDDMMSYSGQSNYFTEITIDDMTAGYEVNISPMIIIQIYLAGLAIVLISIVIPSLMIMRFNPKRILMNTN